MQFFHEFKKCQITGDIAVAIIRQSEYLKNQTLKQFKTFKAFIY